MLWLGPQTFHKRYFNAILRIFVINKIVRPKNTKIITIHRIFVEDIPSLLPTSLIVIDYTSIKPFLYILYGYTVYAWYLPVLRLLCLNFLTVEFLSCYCVIETLTILVPTSLVVDKDEYLILQILFSLS